MRVTDKNFPMDDLLVEKLDLMIKRCTGKNHFDNLIIVDGNEGYGKTNFSIQIAYYVSCKTGRPFSVKNIFFKAEDLLNYAKEHEEQILIFDEAVLGLLSTEWYKKTQQDLLKLFMIARKKKHFYIINIPKFFKLNEYIFVDRSIALLHVYSEDGLRLGRFTYYDIIDKERLFNTFKKTKKRNYREYTFRGTFPDVADQLIDVEEYEKKKDEGIMSIGTTKEKTNPDEIHPALKQLYKFKYNIATSNHYPLTEKAKLLGLDSRCLSEWKKLPLLHPKAFEEYKIVRITPPVHPKPSSQAGLLNKGRDDRKNVTKNKK